MIASILKGYYIVPLLHALDEAGLLEELSGGAEVQLTRISSKDINLPIVRACLDYLFVRGFLTVNGDNYQASAFGQELFKLYPTILLHHSYNSLLANLAHAVTSDQKADINLLRDAALNARASGLLHSRFGTYEYVKQQIKERKPKTIADLGCGNASFMIEVCKERTETRALGLELSPAAISAARDNISAAQLSDRIDIKLCDLRDVDKTRDLLQDGQADFVTSWFVFHEICSADFQKGIDLAAALRCSKRLITVAVTEIYNVDAHGLRQLADRHFPEFILFHTLSGQRLVKRQWLIDCFSSAGFSVKSTHSHFGTVDTGPIVESIIFSNGG